MPDYIKVNSDSKTYPYNVQTLRLDNPYTSFPESIEEVSNDYNVFLVNETAQPAFNSKTQKVILDEPEYRNGQYYQRWKIVSQTLEESKSNANNRINSEWYQVESQGWNSGQGFSLGITPSDVALLVGVFSLAKEAAALGLPLPHLISMDNNPVVFNTIQEMTMLLLQYGQARATLASEFAEKRKAVENATTVEELDF